MSEKKPSYILQTARADTYFPSNLFLIFLGENPFPIPTFAGNPTREDFFLRISPSSHEALCASLRREYEERVDQLRLHQVRRGRLQVVLVVGAALARARTGGRGGRGRRGAVDLPHRRQGRHQDAVGTWPGKTQTNSVCHCYPRQDRKIFCECFFKLTRPRPLVPAEPHQPRQAAQAKDLLGQVGVAAQPGITVNKYINTGK